MGNFLSSDPVSNDAQQSQRNPNRQQRNQQRQPRQPRRPFSQNPGPTSNTDTQTQSNRSFPAVDQKMNLGANSNVQTDLYSSGMSPPPPYEQIFNHNNPPQQSSEILHNPTLFHNVPSAPPTITNSQPPQMLTSQVTVLPSNPPNIPLTVNPRVPMITSPNPLGTSQVPVLPNNPPNVPLTVNPGVPMTTSPNPLGTSQIPITSVSAGLIATTNVPVIQKPSNQIKSRKKRRPKIKEYYDEDEYSDYSDYESDHDKNKMYQGYYSHRDYYDKDEDYVYYLTPDGYRFKHYR